MRGYKNIICEYCGSFAQVPTRRTENFCNNEACINAHFENEKKEENKWIPQKERTVDTKAIEELNTSEIIELARELGRIRYLLIQLILKENDKIAHSNKDDNTLIHSFEFKELTKDEVYETYLKAKERRIERRQAKYKYAIIKMILDSILIKNPEAAVIQAIQKISNSKELKEVINEIKANPELFVVREGELNEK